MKKRRICLVFVFLIVGVLSVGNVWAGGAYSNPKSNNCIYSEINPHRFHPVGCDCITGGSDVFTSDPLSLDWSRSNWNKLSIGGSDDDREDDGSEYYCYVDDPLSKIKPGTGGGKGETRMCTEDNNSTYYELSAVPASSNGLKGNRECDKDYPYCKDKKCNACLEDGDCSAKAPENSVAKCLPLETYAQNNLCNYCQLISGSGPEKITFLFFDDSGGSAEDLVSGLAEPFKHLNSLNKFTFRTVISGDLSAYLSNDKMDSGKVNKKTMETMFQITDVYVNKVCPDSQTIVIVGLPMEADTAGMAISGKEGPLLRKFIFLREANAEVLAHELGHKFADLSDEYSIKEYSGENRRPDQYINNVVKKDKCSTFTDYGIPPPNCVEIPEDKAMKTTGTSIMNSLDESNGKFNIISCAVILSKFGGGEGDIKTQVTFCSSLPGIMSQNE